MIALQREDLTAKRKIQILNNCDPEAYNWLQNHMGIQYKPNFINTLESAT